uniref:Reverse transcriptase zinc-binding domain-containing protein n=1 Tax=Solanum lycopersicum TaxID=4081 RepID=A0A3Q7GTP0_SOLLC
MLDFIKERVRAKIKGWKGLFLSLAGKEGGVNCCTHSQGDGKRKIYFERWDKLCEPKTCGGLDFRDMKAFNKAMLAKLAWRILLNPHLLLAKILKSKYFSNVSFMNATTSSPAS